MRDILRTVYIDDKGTALMRLATAAWIGAALLLGSTPTDASLPDGRYYLTLENGYRQSPSAKPPAPSGKAPSQSSGRKASTPKKSDEDQSEADDGDSEPMTLEGADSHVFFLERVEGRWRPVFAGAIPTRSLTWGLAERVRESGDTVSMSCLMLLRNDAREFTIPKMAASGAPSTLALYEIEFSSGGTKLEGTWKATLNGTALGGKARGEIAAAIEGPRGKPVPTGTHPRFLMRPEDLPALREKAKTDWGKAMFSRLDREDWSRSRTAVGLGLLYQLTGNRTFAERARKLLQEDIDTYWWTPLGPIHDPGHKAVEGMIAYDLIHDACDEQYHERMRAFLRPQMLRLHSFCNIARGNGHPRSNWSAMFNSGAGMAALGLIADTIPCAEEPALAEIPTIKPQADFKPDPDSVPIVPASGGDVREWLMAGPFNIGLYSEHLAELGGPAKARPTRGTTVRLMEKAEYQAQINDGLSRIHWFNKKAPNHLFRGDDLKPLTKPATGAFKDIPENLVDTKDDYMGSPGSVNLWKACGMRNFQTLYFYAVLNNDKARNVMLRTGVIQQVDRCAYIGGRRFGIGEVFRMEPGHYPVLLPVTLTTWGGNHNRLLWYLSFSLSELSEQQMESFRAHRNAEHEFRARARKVLNSLSKDGRCQDIEGLAWDAASRATVEVYVNESIGDHGWNMEGECYTRHSLRAIMPYAHAYRNVTGMPISPKPNLSWVLPLCAMKTVFMPDGAIMHSYGRGGGPMGVDKWARGFGLIPDEMKPASFPAWQRTQALADAGKLKAMELVIADLDPMSAAFMFVNWPLNAQGKPIGPGGPAAGQGLPPVAEDKWRAGFVFRNGYRGEDDIVTLLYGTDNLHGSWGSSETGDPRMIGLGAEWAVRGSCDNRALMSVVWSADMGNNARRAPARFFQHKDDGSGVVTLDMSGVYGGKSGGKPALRSLGVDYSGACGAPALLAVVDSLPGVGRSIHQRKDYTHGSEVPTPQTGTGGRHPFYFIRSRLLAKREMAAELKAAQEVDADSALDKKTATETDSESEDGEKKKIKHETDYSIWQWVTHASNKVSVTANGFLITAPNGATLAATVVCPAKCAVMVHDETCSTEFNYHYDHQGGAYPRKVVRIEGLTEFFVAMTLQKGPAPAVKTSGDDLSTARAAIGGRTVRFDGSNVILE